MSKVKDINNIPKLIKVLDELSRKTLKIGIFGEDDSEILMIARVNEFGLKIDVTPKMRAWFAYQGYPLRKDTTEINIPERSFMRAGFDENEQKIMATIEKLLDKVINLELSVDNFFKVVGESIVGMIQVYLTDLAEPPNHPLTLKKKAPKTNPLVNTGRLRQSITWKVEG